MKNNIRLFLFFLAISHNCFAQKNIIYQFDKCVVDSLVKGQIFYSNQLNKPIGNLKFFAVVIEDDSEYEIFLQEYSYLPKSGLLNLIKRTNRKIKIGKYFIPIIIPADIMSDDLKRDKIAAIPLSGYYIKVIYQDYEQKVVRTSISY